MIEFFGFRLWCFLFSGTAGDLYYEGSGEKLQYGGEIVLGLRKVAILVLG